MIFSTNVAFEATDSREAEIVRQALIEQIGSVFEQFVYVSALAEVSPLFVEDPDDEC